MSLPCLFLKKNEDRRIRAGHLWVFSNEIDTRRSPLTDFAPGDPAELRGADGRPLGTGYVNPASLIAFRLLSRDPAVLPGADLLRERLSRALALRERLFAEPYYRLCHGEGDYLPGLVIDRYGAIFSVQLTTAGMERLKAEVAMVLDELFSPALLLWRNDTSTRTLEGLPLYVETTPTDATPPETLSIHEGGAVFQAPFAADRGGQKTGWFYDQRDNRAAAARLGLGCNQNQASSAVSKSTVLDAFSYVGGFGCIAAKAGAGAVTFLDSSAPALEAARVNLAASAPDCSGTFMKGDALTELATLKDSGQRFDIVCVDPPAFIKRKKDAAEGLAAYRRVNDLAVQLVTDGGIVVSSSCSHHLESAALHRLLAQSAVKRGLAAQLIHQGRQGPDHPVHPAMPETEYLKCYIMRISKY